jgi:hypothetical protein
MNFKEMTKRDKIIIAVLIVLVILIIALVVWWLLRSKTQPVPSGQINTNQGLNIPEELPSASLGVSDVSEPLIDEPELEAGLKAIAFAFAERFGSYSNEGNYNNIESVNNLMTVRMKAWVDNYRLQQSKLPQDSTYYGVTTKALSININTFDETSGRSEIIVSTQRQESRGDTQNPKVYYQDLKLDLVKTGEGWKIDVAQWR